MAKKINWEKSNRSKIALKNGVEPSVSNKSFFSGSKVYPSGSPKSSVESDVKIGRSTWDAEIPKKIKSLNNRLTEIKASIRKKEKKIAHNQRQKNVLEKSTRALQIEIKKSENTASEIEQSIQKLEEDWKNGRL